MYEQFYGLSRTPFAVTPDPSMLFMSRVHREALATIIYGVETRKGFIVCTGEVGTGKSTIIRAFFDQLQPDAVKLIYIFTPQVTPLEIAKYICSELGLKEPDSVFAAVPQLQLGLLEIFESGRTVVLMIDEAQLLPAETLEFLRLLSNFETDTEKLIQIVLVGQPEVDTMLARQDMRQVAQRVALRARLPGLGIEETYEYIDHRLRVCGAADLAQVMSPTAAWQIAEAAGGIPRVVNILADNALIAGFGAAQRPLGSHLAGITIRDFIAKSGPAIQPVVPERLGAGWRAARRLRSALVREKHEPGGVVVVTATGGHSITAPEITRPPPATPANVPSLAMPSAAAPPAENAAATEAETSSIPAVPATPLPETPTTIVEPLSEPPPDGEGPQHPIAPPPTPEIMPDAVAAPSMTSAIANATLPAALVTPDRDGVPVSTDDLVMVTPEATDEIAAAPVVLRLPNDMPSDDSRPRRVFRRLSPRDGYRRAARISTGSPVSIEGLVMVAPLAESDMTASTSLPVTDGLADAAEDIGIIAPAPDDAAFIGFGEMPAAPSQPPIQEQPPPEIRPAADPAPQPATPRMSVRSNGFAAATPAALRTAGTASQWPALARVRSGLLSTAERRPEFRGSR
ncbi:MAG TPA: AAA family ATPase [Stellaceae bacterium]|jgi:type II secretory pathway predicted ATPase ExeA|nr:AAA family ATPase [Stellaceae bacterium]